MSAEADKFGAQSRQFSHPKSSTCWTLAGNKICHLPGFLVRIFVVLVLVVVLVAVAVVVFILGIVVVIDAIRNQ
jgi:hypothetical protein